MLAESLHNVSLLNGMVLSVTTDGFVSDIENLEEKLMTCKNVTFLNMYRDIREKLSGQSTAFEVKTYVKGMIQWTTRGQLSLENLEGNYNIPISAMTGYQKDSNHDSNVITVFDSLKSNNKIFFLEKRLTGALECYKEGSHVSMTTRQKTFRTVFDSKRNVVLSDKTMLDTIPFNHVNEAKLYRTLMMHMKQSVYSDDYTVKTVPSSSNCIDESIKYFLRMVTFFYKHAVPEETLASLIELLSGNMSKNQVLNIIHNYENDKGNVVTKLNKFSRNKEFILDLYDNLLKFDDLSLLNDIFKTFFNNFDLPKSELDIRMSMKEELITRLQDVDLNKIKITEKNNVFKVEFTE